MRGEDRKHDHVRGKRGVEKRGVNLTKGGHLVSPIGYALGKGSYGRRENALNPCMAPVQTSGRAQSLLQTGEHHGEHDVEGLMKASSGWLITRECSRIALATHG